MKRFSRLVLAIVLVIWVFYAAAAVGQTMGAVLSGQPQMLVIPDHPQHASQTGMGQEQCILERSQSVFAQGERPLWELMPPESFVSIADVARAYREEHAKAKKAVISWRE
jgi:hypothetical protein